jgi:hypothetical protein
MTQLKYIMCICVCVCVYVCVCMCVCVGCETNNTVTVHFRDSSQQPSTLVQRAIQLRYPDPLGKKTQTDSNC